MIIQGTGMNLMNNTLRVYADFPSVTAWEFNSPLELYTAEWITNNLGYRYPLSDLARLFAKIKKANIKTLGDANNFINAFVSDNFI